MRLHESPLLLGTLLLPGLSTAWSLPQLNFRLPFGTGATSPQEIFNVENAENFDDAIGPVRIAVIGAGAAGSSSAFWIAKARERHGANVVVDVYEQSDYIGGRELPLLFTLGFPGVFDFEAYK